MQPQIYLLDMIEELKIPLNGLSAGKKQYSWHVGKEFFAEFGDTGVLDADVRADVTIEKSGSYTGLDCQLEGTLTVPCDRCLEDLVLPVSELVRMSVKFGPEPVENQAVLGEEGERETIYLPEDEAVLDMAQIIYDYSMLALPLQRVHAEGECNPDTVRWLSGEADAVGQAGTAEEGNNPFAALKGLFD